MYRCDDSDFKALEEVIVEGKLFRNRGKGVESECLRFERAFAQKIGVAHSILVNSGTNALICALRALNIGSGDEVIIPAYTFFATAVAVINVGATPIIANIDKSLTIDVEDIPRLIRPQTKAIIAVHMDGLPCNLDALKSLARQHQLHLIEDVAQAAGGSYKGARLGSIGDMGCFSFNADKIISAGEGGAVAMSDRVHFEKSLLVQDASAIFGATWKEEFKSITPFVGSSMRVSELTGAMMNVQLQRLDEILSELRKRKAVMMKGMRQSHLPVVESFDEQGECATCVELTLASLDEVKAVLARLNAEKLTAYPLSARPAHACWQWMHLLAAERGEHLYPRNAFLSSIDIITRTIRIDVPFDMPMEKIEEWTSHLVSQIRP